MLFFVQEKMCTASANEDAESDDDDDGIQRWRPVNAVPRIFFCWIAVSRWTGVANCCSFVSSLTPPCHGYGWCCDWLLMRTDENSADRDSNAESIFWQLIWTLHSAHAAIRRALECTIAKKQQAQLMLTNPRDAMLDIHSRQSTVGFRYIFCNYRKTPSTAAQGSARDVTSPTKAGLFNCSIFHILSSKPHPDCL